MNSMFDRVKKALRISDGNTAFDDDIRGLIEAAMIDLQIAGKTGIGTDALIEQAVIMYARANFGLYDADVERFARSYEALKNNITLSGRYTIDGQT